MPAINVAFSDDETGEIRNVAKERGLSMETIVHDMVVGATKARDQGQSFVAGASRYFGEYAQEFGEIFPEGER
jgi:hypothetical protein